MRKFCSIYLIIFLGFIFCGCTQNNFDPTVDMTPRLITAIPFTQTNKVVENVKSAVVGVSVKAGTGTSIGSGVAIADGGYILTNQHVIEGARSITLYFANLSQGSAEYIWSDSSLDLAIIKSAKNLPYLQCGTSKDLKVGDDVLAIGTPLGLQFKHTVTKGIVSALNRTLEVEGNSGANYMQDLIQHDASINPGNSGGPLITMNCQVVGINSLKAEGSEGIGFAIPIEVGSAITRRIVENNGYIAPYVGIFGFDAAIASYLGEEGGLIGVYVVSIDEEGPAATAGIEKGDIVIKVGEKNIENLLDLKTAMFDYNKGDKIPIKILRQGKEEVVEVQTNNK